MRRQLTDIERKQIIADYAMCGNNCEVARKHGIAESTVRAVVKGEPRIARLCEMKKEQNTEDIIAYMDRQKRRVCGMIDKYLDALVSDDKIERATVNQLATTLGTVIDKFLLARGERPGAEEDEAITALKAKLLEREPGEEDDRV